MVICSSITLAWLGNGLLASNGVSMFSNNLLDLGLVCPLSDNPVVSLINTIRGAGTGVPTSISNTNIADSKAKGNNKGTSRAGFSFSLSSSSPLSCQCMSGPGIYQQLCPKWVCTECFVIGDLLLSDPYRPAGFLSEIVGD